MQRALRYVAREIRGRRVLELLLVKTGPLLDSSLTKLVEHEQLLCHVDIGSYVAKIVHLLLMIPDALFWDDSVGPARKCVIILAGD